VLTTPCTLVSSQVQSLDPTALDNTAVKAGFMCLGGQFSALEMQIKSATKILKVQNFAFFLVFPSEILDKKTPNFSKKNTFRHISTMGNPLQNSEFSSLLDSIFKSNLSFLSKTPIARIAYFKPSFYMLYKYIYTYRFACIPLFCFGEST